MKKAKTIGKKTLSVFLAVLMVLTAWVWIAPSKASAAAGTYYVRVNVRIYDYENDFSNKYSTNDDGTPSVTKTAGFSLFYKEENGTGAEKHVPQDLVAKINSKETEISALSDLTKDNWAKDDKNSTKYDLFTYTFEDVGFPTKLTWVIDNGAWTNKASYVISKITVAASEDATETVLWEGACGGESISNSYSGVISPTEVSSNWKENKVAFTTGGSWAFPYAKTVTWTPASLSADTCPKGTATITKDVSVVAVDQYGVQMFDPTWSISSNKNSSNGLSLSKTGASASNTIKITSAANIPSGTDNSQTVTVKAKWDGAGTDITKQLSFILTDATYKATFTYKTQESEFVSKDVSEKTEGYHGVTITTPTVPGYYSQDDYDYDFIGWEPAFSETLISDVNYIAKYDEKNKHFISADYSAVDTIKAEVQAEKEELTLAKFNAKYTLASLAALETAISNTLIDYPLGRTNQSKVDGYAAAIEQAYRALEPNKYNVIFLDRNGAIVRYDKDVEFETAFTPPAFPEEQKNYHDATNHYTYSGWDSDEYTSVIDDLVISPVYTAEAHNFVTETVESTCVQAGTTKHTCQTCGYTYYDGGDQLGEHQWKADFTVDVEPTCVLPGSKSIHCSLCDAQKDITAIEPKGHTWEDFAVAVNPTCTNIGVSTRVCAEPDCKFCEHLVIDPLGHDYKKTTVAPTCTAKGYDEYVCQRENCGHSYRDNYTDIVDHTYGDWITVSEALCEVSGVKKQICTECSFVNLGSINALQHDALDSLNWIVVLAPTCEGKGYQTKTCSKCDIIIASEEIAATGHKYENEGTVVTLAPTCTTKGYTKKTCDTCGDVIYVDIESALGHDWKPYSTTADCTTAGESGEKCSRCNLLQNVAVTDPNGHNFDIANGATYVDEPATCETDGERVITCANANCSVTSTVVLPKTGHNYKAGSTVAPTCTQSGYTVYVCQNDNAHTYNAYDATKPATGHTWGTTPKSKTDATCTTDGSATYKCNNCTEEKTELLAKLGHSWGEWSVTINPTASREGEKTRECERGCKEKVTLPKSGHEMVVDTTASTAPTCTADGEDVYVCTTHTGNAACGYTYKVTVAATGHSYDSGAETTAPKCDTDGEKTYTCGTCGATRTEVIPKTGHTLSTTLNKADCENEGSVVTVCSECTFSITTGIPALGHSYTDSVTKAPTCTAEGVKTYTCAHDSKHTYTESIAMIPHTFKEGTAVDATCTSSGYTPYTCDCSESYVKITNDAKGHNFTGAESDVNNATCVSDGSKKVACANGCDEKITVVIPATGHSYDNGTVVQEQDCTTAEKKEFKCACGDSYIKITKEAKGHSYPDTWTSVQEATTDSYGIEKRSCTACDDTQYKTTAPTGDHNFKLISSEAATCTKDGNKVWECQTHTDCEADYTETIPATGHTHGLVYSAPTCTTVGSTKIICSVDGCGATIDTIEIPATGHIWNDGEVTTQPDCKNEGVMTYTCTVVGCSGSTKTEAIAANPKAHIYAKTTSTDATCLAPATETYVCNGCGDTKIYVASAGALGHDWNTDKTVDIEATCTSTGVKSTHCSRCSETKDAETIPAESHTPATVSEEATCTKAGYSAEVCSACDALLSEITITEAKGHTWGEATVSNATCTAGATETRTCAVEGCGVTDVKIISMPNEHIWGDWTILQGEGKKTRKCNNCDLTEECAIPTSGHNWNGGQETKAATCYEEGIMTYTCQGCDICTAAGTTATETTVIPKLAHTYTKDTTAATCENSGSVTVKCSVAGCGYVAQKVELPATGHTLERDKANDKNASCTDIGWYAYKCKNTNCTYTEKAEIAALNHNYSTTATQISAPTCTENGSKQYKCTRCDDAIVTEIPMTGHSFTITETVYSTCTDKGYTIKKCSNGDCGTRYVVADSFTDALGHTWGEWETVTPATNDAAGLKKRVCGRNADHIEYAPIPMLGHEWNSGEIITPATCEDAGEKKYTCIKSDCAVCNGTAAYYTETIPATGHNMTAEDVAGDCLVPSYKKWTCQNNGCSHSYITITGEADGHNERVVSESTVTCETDGVIKYKCEDCGAEREVVTPKLGHDFEKQIVNATCTTSGYIQYTCKNDSKHAYKEFASEAKGHTWSQWVVTTAPTDSTDGVKERECINANCDAEETQTIPALIHNMVQTKNTAATCTNPGEIIYKCNLTHEGYSEACDYSYTITLPVVPHVLSTVKQDADCKNGGSVITTCSGCNYREETTTAALGHDWNDGQVTETTCISHGQILYTCKRCGDTKKVVLELLQHEVELKETVEATCTSRGYKIFGCKTKDCAYGYTVFGDEPTGHEETEKVITPSSCSAAGVEKEVCKKCGTIVSAKALSPAEHDYEATATAPTCTEMGYTTYTCKNCTASYKDNYVSATGHVDTVTATVESTCTVKGTETVTCKCGTVVSTKELPLREHDFEKTYADGEYTYTCKYDDCRYSYKESATETYKVRFFDAAGEQIGEDQNIRYGQPATEPEAPVKSTDGTHHYIFSGWDRKFDSITSDLDVYPTYEKEVHYGGEATCNAKASCEACGKAYGETDASKHVIATRSQSATCEEDGWIERYCTNESCNHSERETIKKIGHNFGEWEVYQEGNCAAPTISIRKCLNYGCDELEEKSTLSAHVWYSYAAVEPGCTTEGYTEYKYCVGCGLEIESVVIPALGHRDINGDGQCDYCRLTESVPECTCLCHSTGFMKFIYSIMRFFWMITRSSQKCTCGAVHY